MKAALHTTFEGKYKNHQHAVEVLFIGENPRGPRGGTSGIAVDAVAVAQGKIAYALCTGAGPYDVLVQLAVKRQRPLKWEDLRRKGLKSVEEWKSLHDLQRMSHLCGMLYEPQSEEV